MNNDEILKMYEYVFKKSLAAPWTNQPEVIDPELAKAICYETLKLVAEYLDEAKSDIIIH